jgi:hypothetical protein
MPKNKKEPILNEKKKNLFFYEILGVVLAVLSFFALAKLGKFGLYLFLIVKFLFGDWAFLFIIIGILAGCYFLMVHDHLPISSLRVLGIFLIFLSLLVLSHFSMHDYVKQYSTDYFGLTFSLYVDYFKSNNSESMTGGGIIGMAFFYLFYFLLSSPGVIIISLLFIILGISFVSRKTLNEFFKLIIKGIKKMITFFKYLYGKSNQIITSLNKEFNSNQKRLPKNFVKKNNFNYPVYSTKAEDLVTEIKVVLNKLNFFHYQVKYYLTPHLIVIEINSLVKIDYNLLEQNLTKCITDPFLIKINEDDHLIMIELSTENIRKISLDEVLNKYNNNVLFLGINDHNEVEALNKDYKSVLMFINNIENINFYIALALIKKYNIRIFDYNNELKKFECFTKLYTNDLNHINKFIIDIENKEDESLEICFINLHKNIINNDIISKIRYLIELSKELPFYFIVRINGYFDKEAYFYDCFSYLLTIDNCSFEVLKLFGFYQSTGLMIGYEGLIKNLDIVMRVAVGGLSNEEEKKLEQ